jgi:hypothetical protein
MQISGNHVYVHASRANKMNRKEKVCNCVRGMGLVKSSTCFQAKRCANVLKSSHKVNKHVRGQFANRGRLPSNCATLSGSSKCSSSPDSSPANIAIPSVFLADLVGDS